MVDPIHTTDLLGWVKWSDIKRTPNSLNAGLPIKWTAKSFKQNDIFSMKKILGLTLELSAKMCFSLEK